MIQIKQNSESFYVMYDPSTLVISGEITTLPANVNLVTNANCAELNLFEAEGLNEIILSDTFEGLQSKINNLNLTYATEVVEELFPYPDRPIRVFMTHAQVTEVVDSEYKSLINYALAVPHNKTPEGVVMWLVNYGNESYSNEQVEGVLRMFGAKITIRE